MAPEMEMFPQEIWDSARGAAQPSTVSGRKPLGVRDPRHDPVTRSQRLGVEKSVSIPDGKNSFAGATKGNKTRLGKLEFLIAV
jgi:hypothetical protein